MPNPFPSPEPLLGPTVSTISIRQWLQDWHDDHCLVSERAINNKVAWDGRWVEERTLQELYFDLKNWGFDLATGRRIVQDIVREKDVLRERRRLEAQPPLWFVLLCLSFLLAAVTRPWVG